MIEFSIWILLGIAFSCYLRIPRKEIDPFELDPQEIQRIEANLRKIKDRAYDDLVSIMPTCPACGPNVKHINFTII